MQVIAHNMLAEFTDRQLNITSKNKSKSTERLSSGYRINRSADDAAGLQISEKMRWQIRGLNRGAKNIEDGISLVQTADGAMSEMHSVLHRIRELSIQAYNDTNTTEDRQAIQDEVDQSLKELQRIAETTTFNTRQLLGGNPTSIVWITHDKEVTTKVRQTRTTSVPSWLYDKMDKALTVHADYTQGGQAMENMQTTKSATNSTPDKYYGPKNPYLEAQGYKHVKEWTDTIADNPSAKIDFSGLITESHSALDLYNNLFNLIGSKISFGCGTCSSYINSITFAGNEPAMTTENFSNAEGAATDIKGSINLTNLGYFNEIRELLTEHVKAQEEGTSDAAKEEAEVEELAKKIAGSLRNEVVSALEKTTRNHFDRVMKVNDPSDPNADYSLYVYDYRDTDALTNMTAADTSIRTTATVTYLVDSTMVEKGTKAAVKGPIMIECGALAPNAIAIDLPDVTLAALGISDYKINRYHETKTYSDDYQKKLQEYYDSRQVETHQGTREERYVKIPGKSPVYAEYETWVNGEKKINRVLVQPGKEAVYDTRTVNYTYTTIKYTKPYPTAQQDDMVRHYSYDPDSVELIDGAIAKVSEARSRMGAIQNRLEHAHKMNENGSENTQAAESRIRDTDMAEEMTNYAKHSILQQAGQAMLAQANQMPNNILSLLSQ